MNEAVRSSPSLAKLPSGLDSVADLRDQLVEIQQSRAVDLERRLEALAVLLVVGEVLSALDSGEEELALVSPNGGESLLEHASEHFVVGLENVAEDFLGGLADLGVAADCTANTKSARDRERKDSDANLDEA